MQFLPRIAARLWLAALFVSISTVTHAADKPDILVIRGDDIGVTNFPKGGGPIILEPGKESAGHRRGT